MDPVARYYLGVGLIVIPFLVPFLVLLVIRGFFGSRLARGPYSLGGPLAGLPRGRARRVQNAISMGRRVTDPRDARAAIASAEKTQELPRAWLPVFVGIMWLESVGVITALSDPVRLPNRQLMVVALLFLPLTVAAAAVSLRWTRSRVARAVSLNRELVEHPDGPLSPERPPISRRVAVVLAGLWLLTLVVTAMDKGLSRTLVFVASSAWLVGGYFWMWRYR